MALPKVDAYESYGKASTLGLRLLLSIYAVLCIVLTVKFIKSAIELFVLRVGISFAAVGLMDSDGGSFKPYAKKFFQVCFTILLQTCCFKLSAIALVNSSPFWALAFISMAMTAPAFLQEFIMTNPGGGGKLQQAMYSVMLFRSFKRG